MGYLAGIVGFIHIESTTQGVIVTVIVLDVVLVG